jgi:hypothetical protein
MKLSDKLLKLLKEKDTLLFTKSEILILLVEAYKLGIEDCQKLIKEE